MDCKKIPQYINSLPISTKQKESLRDTHNSIFEKVANSKSIFRKENGRFLTKQFSYFKALTFQNEVNSGYRNKQILKLDKGKGSSYIVSVDVTRLATFEPSLSKKEIEENIEYFENDEPFVNVSSIKSSTVEEVTNIIQSQLPKEISDIITVLQHVPKDILGRSDLYLSMKDVLEEKGITSPFLINWLGVNLSSNLTRGNIIKSITSESHIEKMANDSYNKLLKLDDPILKNKDIKESFDKWVKALENYPVVFKDLMLKHAIKHLRNPERRSKFVLQLSTVALQQTYGIAVNKPHELNRIGKLYDSEVLKTVSDAVGHEPSASGKGYWVHIPRTSNSKNTYKNYTTYDEWLTDITRRINILESENTDEFYKKTYHFKLQKNNYYEIENSIGGILTDKKYTENKKEIALNDFLKKSKEEKSEIIKKLVSEKNNEDKSKWDNLDNSSLLQFKVNVELLRKLSPSTWCTASGMASHYVENYDNYLLIVDGITVAGIEAYPTEPQIPKEELLKKLDKINTRIEIGDGNYEDYNRKEELENQLNGKLPKIKVKEVTSRGNNGTSSIDHYDDIFAFFEKHNLDTNNNSLQKAKNAKDLGKKDSEIVDRIDFEGDDFYYNDHDYDDYAYEAAENEYIERVRNVTTVEEALNLPYLDQRYFGELPEIIRADIRVATKGVDTDFDNISNINSTLPFYIDLAKKAVISDYNTYNYISQETRNNPEIKKIYEDKVAEETKKTEQERIRIANLTPEQLRAENRQPDGTLNDDLPFSKTNTNQIQGYYDAKNDKVVVIASNTPVDEAAKVGIHEVFHRGFLRMAKELGGEKELFQVLKNAEKQLMEKLPELLKRTGHKSLESLMLDYGFDKNSEEGKFKLLQELSARWAETLIDKPKPTWWKELLKSIGNWIKQFTGKTLNEQEVNELVGGFVKYGTNSNENNIDKNGQGKLFQLASTVGKIASEKTIRDLAARMSDRIGIPIKFESDRSKMYKGNIKNDAAYVNLAYATLDTVPHEILAHPIIRALKIKSEQSIDVYLQEMMGKGIITKEC